ALHQSSGSPAASEGRARASVRSEPSADGARARSSPYRLRSHLVADAAHRDDRRASMRAAQLLANASDVHIYGAFEHRHAVAAIQAIDQLAAAEYPPGLFQQRR